MSSPAPHRPPGPQRPPVSQRQPGTYSKQKPVEGNTVETSQTLTPLQANNEGRDPTHQETEQTATSMSESVAVPIASVQISAQQTEQAGGEESQASSEFDMPASHELKLLNYREVDDKFQSDYCLENQNDSTILDIVAVYVKGQKILYTEAKTICEQRLNFLMLPAIFTTAVCTILSLVLQSYTFGATIVSCLNGLNAFILALINYLKLDARAEAHRTSAYKFDKLESFLEFNSGKVLFVDSSVRDKEVNVNNLIKTAEKEIRDIKETNQFVLPEYIRFNFPHLYNTNVFAEVKLIMNKEAILLNKLKDVLNEIRRHKHALIMEGKSDDVEDDTIKKYEEEKRTFVRRLLVIRDDYLTIDHDFERELKLYRESAPRRGAGFCNWLKS